MPRGIDLRGVDADAVAAQLAQHPWIASARAVELPTGRLLVEVSERHAVATVSARDAKQAFAVDANGTAFAKLGDDALGELPRLVQSDPIVIGEPNPTLAQAVELAGQIAAAGLPRPLEIAIAAADDPDGFSLRLADFAPRIVLGRDGLGERLARARARARSRAAGSGRGRHTRSSLRRPGGAARDAVLDRGGRRDGDSTPVQPRQGPQRPEDAAARKQGG